VREWGGRPGRSSSSGYEEEGEQGSDHSSGAPGAARQVGEWGVMVAGCQMHSSDIEKRKEKTLFWYRSSCAAGYFVFALKYPMKVVSLLLAWLIIAWSGVSSFSFHETKCWPSRWT
jgi:hypothetical protein